MKTDCQPDEIIRSKRKTLALSIDGQGRLIVRAPWRYAEEKIFAFIKEKEGWIKKKQAQRRAAAIPLPSENLEGYAFPLLGERTEITLSEGKKVLYDKENKRLFVPKERGKEKLVAWLKRNAKRIFTAVTEQKSKEMGLSYSSVTVTSARTRWGSCTGKNALRYTFRLLYCPREIIEYVVVHELAHIRHKNHSPLFWKEVESYLPDWKEKRKWLKGHGSLMEIF